MTAKLDITLPTIHMNGDSAKTLMEDHLTAITAINDAIEALAKACPNGRNFYPQGPDAISKAIAEHTARLEKLKSVHDEIGTILGHIADHQ